jgi:hypothetical protein
MADKPSVAWISKCDLAGERHFDPGGEVVAHMCDKARGIRTIYVDDHAGNVALGPRIIRGSVYRDRHPGGRAGSEQRYGAVSRV